MFLDLCCFVNVADPSVKTVSQSPLESLKYPSVSHVSLLQCSRLSVLDLAILHTYILRVSGV